MITVVAALAAGAFAAFVLTAVVRRYALHHEMLDLPNHRSSHAVATPRGGGAAIAVVVLIGTAVLGVTRTIEPRTAIALAAGGSLIAGVGWLEDRYGVAATLRFAIHIAAAALATYCLGGLPSLDFGVAAVPLGLLGHLVALLWIAWGTNLFNFMDGIDGIAAGEALCVGIAGAFLLGLTGATGLATVSLLVGAACCGFLFWNWAPAKIFMGDVGSGLLGFVLAALGIAAANEGAVALPVWILLLGVFVFDATATLIRRIVRRDRWFEAHRCHAYQRAILAGAHHAEVTIVVIALDIVLALLALSAVLSPPLIPTALTIALALLLTLYLAVEARLPMVWSDILLSSRPTAHTGASSPDRPPAPTPTPPAPPPRSAPAARPRSRPGHDGSPSSPS